MAELGLIEGFFGRPWSWAERRDAVRFLRPHGYRFYLYAPKADAMLRRLWQQPWPNGQVRAIRIRFTADWAGREPALAAALPAVQQAVWQAERDGDASLISLMAGAGVGAIPTLRPAALLVQDLVEGATAVLSNLPRSTAR